MKLARVLAALTFFASALHAGVLQGIVLENLTSRPLSRARVTLARLEGSRLVPAGTLLSSRSGQFVFPQASEGYYILIGSRPGFAETRYGQRRNSGHGTPIHVPADGSQFVELRLKRFGAVAGRVTDENGVGLPGIPVLAYTAASLMTIAASAKSDDRGDYRITGLLPGRHFVRTDGTRLEDGLTLLPTYHPYASVLIRDARFVQVDLDADTPNVDIQPASGRLANLTVKVQSCIGGAQVTLATDTGRRQSIAPCNLGPVTFENLAPGEYEVLAEGFSDGRPVAAFQSVSLDSSREVGLNLRPLPEWAVRLTGAGGLTLGAAGLIVRRRDLAGPGPELPLTSDRLALLPGSWQIAARPPASHYLSEFKVGAAGPRRGFREASPDWFDVHLDYSLNTEIVFSAQPASLSGRVTLNGKPALAAPVYLFPTAQPTRRRMNGIRTAYAGTNGNYRIDGLAPGSYLVLSSFDISEINEESMTASQARPITIEDGRPATQDLELAQIPQ